MKKNLKAFGEESFISTKSRNECAKTVTFTTLCKISQKDFIDTLKEFDEDKVIFFQFFSIFFKEKFLMLKDNILHNNELLSKYTNCYLCDNPKHTYEKCPDYHYIPKIEILI